MVQSNPRVVMVGGVQICFTVVDDSLIFAPCRAKPISVEALASRFLILAFNRCLIGGYHGDLVPIW